MVDIQGGLTVGGAVGNTLVKSVDAPVLANTSEVEVSSTVNSIFLNVQVAATSAAALANVYMTVSKNPGANLPTLAPNAVGAADSKNYIFHQEMLMLQKVNPGIPRTLFKGVLSIPKSFRAQKINDLIQIRLLTPGITAEFCIQCIYKEFR